MPDTKQNINDSKHDSASDSADEDHRVSSVTKDDLNGSAQNQPDQPPQQPDVEKQPNTENTNEAFSIYNTSEKRLLCIVASLCGFLSPISGSIYYPALTQIERDLNESADKINITLTTYFIFQGIAPTFVGGFGDRSGRRLGFFVCFIIYMAANVGLGIQNSYPALLVLRMVQSAGSSGMIALSQAVMADIVTSSERGQYMAYASLGSLLGPNLGPVLGGIIAQYLGWHWIFWILLILAGAIFIPVALFLPETNRKIVKNGSYPPPKILTSITSIIQQRRRRTNNTQPDPKEVAALHAQYRIRFPDPLGTLKIAFDKQAFLILFNNGIVVCTMYAFMTGIPTLYKQYYGYDEIIIGLCYLPFGLANFIAVFGAGKLIDWNFRRHAKKVGLTVVRNRKQDLADFPIERARLEVAIPSLLLGAVWLIIYAWLLNFRVPAAGPLVFSGLIGLFCGTCFQVANLLMIDTFPEKAGTAAAAGNLFRCLLGALAAGVIQPMFNAMGVGWAYTFWALVWVVYCPVLVVLMKHGPRWRKERVEREKRSRLRKEEKMKAKSKAGAVGGGPP